MKKKELFLKLDEFKGKELVIETQQGIIKKLTIEKSIHHVIEDRLHIKNIKNKDYAVINLNMVRDIQETNNEIMFYIDDNEETKIKISAI